MDEQILPAPRWMEQPFLAVQTDHFSDQLLLRWSSVSVGDCSEVWGGKEQEGKVWAVKPHPLTSPGQMGTVPSLGQDSLFALQPDVSLPLLGYASDTWIGRRERMGEDGSPEH